MGQEIRNTLKKRREAELNDKLNDLVDVVMDEGYDIQFGEIGNKTTYVLLSKGDEEIVGYTFIKNVQYKNETIGRYKALQQALARKALLEQQEEEKNKEQ